MTLALAYAGCSPKDAEPQVHTVYVMADTRLTAGNDFMDIQFKALTLGQRSAAVAAGHATPFMLAVEGARPFIAANAERQRKLGRQLSVWAEASMIWAHLCLIFDDFQRVYPEAHVTILVSGFFSDNRPGIVRLELRKGYGQILVFRPRLGERAFAVVGVEEYIPILQEAFRRSMPPNGKGYHDVASVLWDIIKHQGTPTRTVGGALAFGFANSDNPTYQWPIISLDGLTTIRGITYPEGPWPKPLQIDYNPSLFAQIEREHHASNFPSYDACQDALLLFDNVAMGDVRLIQRTADDSWLLEKLSEDTNGGENG